MLFLPDVQEERGISVTFKLCKEWLLSSCHVMSLNYVKKTKDFTILFAIGLLK